MSNAAIVKVLLLADARVNTRSKERATALHFASNVRIVKLLVAAGADVNAADRHKLRPLHFAAVRGIPQVARELLSAGAEVDSLDEYGRTPLQIAADYGFSAVVNALLDAGANPNIATKRFQFTPLRSAIAENRPEERLKIIKRLIEADARIERRDFDGNTALMCAARSGNAKILKALIEAGANLESATSDGFTPLHFAILSEKPECVALLLKAGANINQRISAKFGDKIRAGKNTYEVATALRLNRIAKMLNRTHARSGLKS